MWSARSHSSHSANNGNDSIARFIERETGIFVEDKDTENTEKVSETTDKCSRKRKFPNSNKRLC